jgi:hypothetical protein
MFQSMTELPSNRVGSRTVFLTVLLLAFVMSGIPRTEMHSHSVAQVGHVHVYQDHHEHAHGESDNEQRGDADNIADPGVIHVHDVGIQSLTLIPSLIVAPVRLPKLVNGVPPPETRPPDNPVPPLYRPPIV